ncbi:MAG: glycosyltransferase family 4 protein [Minisyncoccia bacterium]
MKLVIATPLYPPESGGPATYAKLLEDELPKYGIEPTVVRFSEVLHFPKVLRHFLYMGLVKRALKESDAVLALDPVSTGFPAYKAARALGKPLYVKIVGDYAWEQGTQRFGITDSLDAFVKRRKVPLPVRMMRLVETLVAKAAVRIIVPSAYLKRIIGAWGVDTGKIDIIYNAAPLLPPPSSYARPNDVPPGPYLICVARLVPWKGMDGVIRALKRLRETRPELSLVIVGEGPEETRLKALARDEGLTDAVVFVGRKPQGEAPAYLLHAEAFILNTGYEGFSHLILEAFTLSVPVITTPIGGNTEQVEEGISGLLVPFQDDAALAAAVERLLCDRTLRARIIEGATKRLTAFSRERLGKELSTLLTSSL